MNIQAELANQESRGCLANALHVKDTHSHRKYRIGRILVKFGAYDVGDFVLCEPYDEPDRRMTIEMPMTPKQLESWTTRGGIMTIMTTVCCPPSVVEIVL